MHRGDKERTRTVVTVDKVKKTITLPIAGKNYHLPIDPVREELYVEAARRIDEQISKFTTTMRVTTEDGLALVALHYAIKTLTSERSTSLGSEDLEALAALERRLRAYTKE